MKKHILSLALALIVTIGGLYPDCGRIVAFDEDRDMVIVKTCEGFLWEYEGIEDFSIGDMVGIMFHDNDTPNNIFDDIIVRLRYAMQIDDFYMPEDEFIILEDLPLIEEPEFPPEEIVLDLELIELF